MNFKIKMLKNVISVLCAAVMATSSGVVTSVGAVGGKQTQITQKEEAKTRFDKLSKGMDAKRNAFINWIISVTVEVESIEIFTTSSDNANDLFNQINSGWDKNTLEKQNELINKYESAINNCIKVMDDYRSKYTKKESVNESQISILNINKEAKKIEDNKGAKKERILSRKDELQSLYDNFKKSLAKWKKSVSNITEAEAKMTNIDAQRQYLEMGFDNCIEVFDTIVGDVGVINEETLLESELTEKDINNLVQNVNKVMRDSEDLIKEYINQTEKIQKDRKNRIEEQRSKYEEKRKEFDKWKERNGIIPQQDTNWLAYYKVQQMYEKLKKMQKYEEKDVEEYSEMVDKIIESMDKFVNKNEWQIIDDNKDVNDDEKKDEIKDENDDWEILG